MGWLHARGSLTEQLRALRCNGIRVDETLPIARPKTRRRTLSRQHLRWSRALPQRANHARRALLFLLQRPSLLQPRRSIPSKWQTRAFLRPLQVVREFSALRRLTCCRRQRHVGGYGNRWVHTAGYCYMRQCGSTLKWERHCGEVAGSWQPCEAEANTSLSAAIGRRRPTERYGCSYLSRRS